MYNKTFPTRFQRKLKRQFSRRKLKEAAPFVTLAAFIFFAFVWAAAIDRRCANAWETSIGNEPIRGDLAFARKILLLRMTSAEVLFDFRALSNNPNADVFPVGRCLALDDGRYAMMPLSVANSLFRSRLRVLHIPTRVQYRLSDSGDVFVEKLLSP